MDISSFIPSSDNLYKFLFIGGITLLSFSFIYPLEKKQRLELLVNTYNERVEILNNEIKELNSEVLGLEKITKTSYSQLEAANNLKNKQLAKQKIIDIKTQYNKAFNEVEKKEKETTIKNIEMIYKKKEIDILNKHINSFEIFRYTFLFVGMFFSIFGLINWYRLTKKIEKNS